MVQPATYGKAASIKSAPGLTTAPISPAGCSIEKLDNPHDAKSVGKTLPGMHIKVNAKTQCNKPVTQLTLTVTIINPDNMDVVARTTTKEVNKPFIENENTWFTCKNTNKTTYQGLALGTSLEDGKDYEQIKMGNKMTWDCGYK